MTSPSDQQSSNTQANSEASQAVSQAVNRALDSSAANMSAKTSAELAHIRQQALKHLNRETTRAKPALFDSAWVKPFFQLAMPVAAVALVVVSLQPSSDKAIPALPLAMTTSQMPAEDLALLQDLEFVTWLAENEQEISL
ncbi:hypothetical protein [Thalassomonas actiniarum]|uniref:DUF3619 family protein n=1 Tax=Thalassomonas actiniarum TaxID=485447 RepID=A0AAE9YT32_9GAMM|nr:hypothetical protein [Thalassomonas actiniarum]WDE00715.1 hypothetical protein SG35_008835 [Thalassomonas actiniarum]